MDISVILNNLITGWGAPWSWFLAVLAAVRLSPFKHVATSPASRARWRTWIDDDGLEAGHRKLLGQVLDWIDAKLSQPEIAKHPADSPRVAWSGRLFDIALLLAVLYPILSLWVQWALLNHSNIGAAEVLPPAEPQIRMAVIGWIIGTGILLFFSARASTPPLLRWSLLVTAIGGYSLGSYLLEPHIGAFAVAVAVAFAGAFAGAGAFAFVGPGVVAVAFVDAGAVAFAFAGAFAGAFALAVRTAPPYFAFWSFLFASMTATLIWFAPETLDISSRAFILFLGILPLFNALADFASVGMTRYLIRRGAEGSLPGRALLDAVAGALIFAALGCTLILYIHLVQPGGTPLIDLGTFFAALAANPGDYPWLAVMMLSTLLPTAIHLCLGLLALYTLWPGSIRQPIRAMLKEPTKDGDTEKAGWGYLLLLFGVTLSIWAPIAAFYWLFTSGFTDWLIAAFAGFEKLIGAIA